MAEAFAGYDFFSNPEYKPARDCFPGKWIWLHFSMLYEYLQAPASLCGMHLKLHKMKARSTFLILALAVMLGASEVVTAQQSKSTCCDLKSDMRKLWEDHITWTRNVIFNIIDELPGTTEAVNRLLQNQVDIGNAIKPFYGGEAGNQLTALLREHILIAADLLTALDDGNTAALNDAIARWYANADDIAAFLAAANPNWPLEEMKAMMREHLDLTTAEAVARKTADYAADVAAYDAVHLQILEMADMLTEGIIRQFPNQFRGCAGGKNAPSVELSASGITLGQNAPNPFTDRTTIAYLIPETVKQAQLMVYDDMGNVVRKMDIRVRGEGTLTLDASKLRKGIYKYSLIADGKIMDTKTMIR
jgi:hypothetical protein